MEILTRQVPKRWDFDIYRGDRWPPVSFRVVDEDGIPVENYIANMQIKRNRYISFVNKTINDDDGFYVDNELRTFDTIVDLTKWDYFYDIQITLPSGNVFTIYYGEVRVRQDLTRGNDSITSLILNAYPVKTVVVPGANYGIISSFFPYDLPFNLVQ